MIEIGGGTPANHAFRPQPAGRSQGSASSQGSSVGHNSGENTGANTGGGSGEGRREAGFPAGRRTSQVRHTTLSLPWHNSQRVFTAGALEALVNTEILEWYRHRVRKEGLAAPKAGQPSADHGEQGAPDQYADVDPGTAVWHASQFERLTAAVEGMAPSLRSWDCDVRPSHHHLLSITPPYSTYHIIPHPRSPRKACPQASHTP